MSKGSKRDWLLLLMTIAFTLFIASRFTSAQSLLATLSQGLWGWLLVAALTHALYFVLYAAVYKSAFAAVNYETRMRDLIPLVFASLFVNGIVPTGGAGGAALFVEDAIRRGQSGARAAVGVILTVVADLLTLIPFIIYANVYLLFRNDLQFYDVVGSAVFVLGVCGLGGILVLGHVKPEMLQSLLVWVQHTVNWVGGWFKRPNLLSDDWSKRNAAQFANAGDAMIHHPKQLGITMLWGVLLHLVDLAGLYALFLAFRYPVDLGAVTAGFAIGIVFWLITILPQGVGAAEGIMSLIYISLGVQQPVAVAVVLAFRGLNFWLPLLVGFFMLRRTSLFSGKPAASGGGRGGQNRRAEPGTRAETEAEV